MSDEKTHKIIIAEIIIGGVVAVITAFISIKIWGLEQEQLKLKLAFEEKLTIRQIEVTERLIEKSAVVFQYAPLYRQKDIMNVDVDNPLLKYILKEAIKGIESPRIDKDLMFNTYLEFQVALIASKPYIDKNVFESLSQYSMFMNQFIHNQSTSKELLKLYEQGGIHLNSAIARIRKIYRYESLPNGIYAFGA